MLNDFAGKVSIVTGASTGMGAAAARILADRGAKVVIADIAEEAGKSLAAEIGNAALFIRCDVTEPSDAQAAVRAAVDRFGRLDALFNNAGKGHLAKTQELESSDWHHIIAVNLHSVFNMSKFAMAAMKATGGGAIVNTASVDGIAADRGMAAYNAAKGGVVNYTRSLALDGATDNIRANAVCPGWISDTPMTAHMANNAEVSKSWSQAVPLGRGGKAIEVAQVMVFLASDAASYVTGAIVPVDGGLTCETGFPRIA